MLTVLPLRCRPPKLLYTLLALLFHVIATTQGFVTPAQNIVAFDLAPDTCATMADLGVKMQPDNTAVVNNADVLVIAVKPSVIPAILKEIKGIVGKTLVVSIAAGVTLATIERVRMPHHVPHTLSSTPLTSASLLAATATQRPCHSSHAQHACVGA